jgi:hypothetical protein
MDGTIKGSIITGDEEELKVFGTGTGNIFDVKASFTCHYNTPADWLFPNVDIFRIRCFFEGEGGTPWYLPALKKGFCNEDVFANVSRMKKSTNNLQELEFESNVRPSNFVKDIGKIGNFRDEIEGKLDQDVRNTIDILTYKKSFRRAK